MSLVLSIFVSTAIAAGTFSLKGTIKGFNADFVEIVDGNQVYSVKKAKLSLVDQSNLKGLKAGQNLVLSVPFDAVSEVKKLK